MDIVEYGLGTPNCPFTNQLRCKGCGRYIGLHDRTGTLVGMEYHGYSLVRAWDKVTERGFMGPGMFDMRREHVCTWDRRD